MAWQDYKDAAFFIATILVYEIRLRAQKIEQKLDKEDFEKYKKENKDESRRERDDLKEYLLEVKKDLKEELTEIKKSIDQIRTKRGS